MKKIVVALALVLCVALSTVTTASAAEESTVNFVFDGEEISISVPDGCPYYFLAFDVTVGDLHNDWILIFSESPYLMGTSGSDYSFELRSSKELYSVFYRSSFVSTSDSAYVSSYLVGKPGLNFVYRSNYDVMWSGGSDGNDDIFFKSIPLENGESFFSDAVILPVLSENIGELVVERNGVNYSFTAEYPYYIVFYDLIRVGCSPLSVFFSDKPLTVSEYLNGYVFLTSSDSDTEVMKCQANWLEAPSSTAKATETYDTIVIEDFGYFPLADRSEFENCVYYSNYDLCDYVSRDTVALTSSPAPEIVPDDIVQPDTPLSPDIKIENRLAPVITVDSLSGTMKEVIYLLPVVIPACVIFVGIRKGLAFVRSNIRSA